MGLKYSTGSHGEWVQHTLVENSPVIAIAQNKIPGYSFVLKSGKKCSYRYNFGARTCLGR